MSDLLKIQQEFARHIFKKSDKEILKNLPYSELESLERLDIYRNNVLGNFESILSSIYVVSKKIIGAKKFDDLQKKFCQKFPSKSGNLNDFGAEFPQFIKKLEPLFLKDLAQLELFYHQSYFAKKSYEKIELKKLKKISAEQFSKIIFALDQSCVFFASKFAIFSIWQKEKKIKNFTKPELVLIHDGHVLLLNEEEFSFLMLIKKQKPLYQIYQLLRKKFKRDLDIGALINHFISNGIITKFDL